MSRGQYTAFSVNGQVVIVFLVNKRSLSRSYIFVSKPTYYCLRIRVVYDESTDSGAPKHGLNYVASRLHLMAHF
jgi:hypothetical protein